MATLFFASIFVGLFLANANGMFGQLNVFLRPAAVAFRSILKLRYIVGCKTLNDFVLIIWPVFDLFNFSLIPFPKAEFPHDYASAL